MYFREHEMIPQYLRQQHLAFHIQKEFQFLWQNAAGALKQQMI